MTLSRLAINGVFVEVVHGMVNESMSRLAINRVFVEVVHEMANESMNHSNSYECIDLHLLI